MVLHDGGGGGGCDAGSGHFCGGLGLEAPGGEQGGCGLSAGVQGADVAKHGGGGGVLLRGPEHGVERGRGGWGGGGRLDGRVGLMLVRVERETVVDEGAQHLARTRVCPGERGELCHGLEGGWVVGGRRRRRGVGGGKTVMGRGVLKETGELLAGGLRRR